MMDKNAEMDENQRRALEMMTGLERAPHCPPSPGRIIQQELNARNWTHLDLARKMDMSVIDIDRIVRSDGYFRSLAADLAIRLGNAFGTSPYLWARLNAEYGVWRALLDNQSLQHGEKE